MALPKADTQLDQFSALCTLWSGLTDLGLHAEAERHMTQALDIARQLTDSRPGAEAQAMLAASLYDRAGSLWRLGRPGEALADLQQSEALYRALEGVRGDGEPLQLWRADVLALRGQINHDSGQRASAVMDLDEAVSQCFRATQAQHAARSFTGRARILALNARILADSGDADLALESAGWAYRLFVSARGSGKATPAHTEFWALAAGIIIEIHAAAGRKALVENPARLAVELERSRHGPGPLDDRAAAALAQALVRQAMVLSGPDAGHDAGHGAGHSVGKDAQAARAMQEAHKLSQRAAAQTELAMREGPRHYVPLAAALKVAQEELGEAQRLPAVATVTGSPLEAGQQAGNEECKVEEAWLTPSSRLAGLGPGAAAIYVQLAQAGCELLPRRKPEGLRLALEACYGFAAALKQQLVSPRNLAEAGPFWGRALLACSRTYEAAGDVPMALDLATWGEDLAKRLLDVPTPSTLPVAGELMEHYTRLSGGAEPSGSAPPTLEAAAQG